MAAERPGVAGFGSPSAALRRRLLAGAAAAPEGLALSPWCRLWQGGVRVPALHRSRASRKCARARSGSRWAQAPLPGTLEPVVRSGGRRLAAWGRPSQSLGGRLPPAEVFPSAFWARPTPAWRPLGTKRALQAPAVDLQTLPLSVAPAAAAPCAQAAPLQPHPAPPS